MVAYQNGDYDAFLEIYRRYSSKIYSYIRARLREGPATDEVFQTVFLKFHEFRRQYDAAYPLRPWLFTICRNTLVDYRRKHGRHNFTVFDEESFGGADNVTPVEQSNEIPIAQLSQEYQRALELRFLEDLSFDEISGRLHITPANARQRVSRAVRALRKMVGLKKPKSEKDGAQEIK